jgi:hypothetical protein
MTITYENAWQTLPFGHPDTVGDFTIRFSPTPQWTVLANVASRWRGLTPESPMRDVGAAMKAFTDRYPEIIKKIEAFSLTDLPSMDGAFASIVEEVEKAK